MTRRAEPLMRERGGGSVVTMTYLGGERAVPNYNVMGVAKAALESSMRYLAADLGRGEHPRQRDQRRAGAHALGTLDHGVHDDGGDRRRAGAAQAQHRRVRRRLGGAVPAVAARLLGHRGRSCTSTRATTRWACRTGRWASGFGTFRSDRQRAGDDACSQRRVGDREPRWRSPIGSRRSSIGTSQPCSASPSGGSGAIRRPRSHPRPSRGRSPSVDRSGRRRSTRCRGCSGSPRS